MKGPWRWLEPCSSCSCERKALAFPHVRARDLVCVRLCCAPQRYSAGAPCCF